MDKKQNWVETNNTFNTRWGTNVNNTLWKGKGGKEEERRMLSFSGWKPRMMMNPWKKSWNDKVLTHLFLPTFIYPCFSTHNCYQSHFQSYWSPKAFFVVYYRFSFYYRLQYYLVYKMFTMQILAYKFHLKLFMNKKLINNGIHSKLNWF